MRQPPPYVLLPPGQTAQIGPERGTPINEGIACFDSPHGSYRYVFYRHGEIVSGLQVMSRDGAHGSIAYVFTRPEHRREKLAMRLLQAARQDFESVDHSTDLSDYGRLWKRGVGDNPPRAKKALKRVRRAIGKGQDCYPGAEVVYHAGGGRRAGLTPVQQRHEGVSHWWVRGPGVEILDPATAQFRRPVPYERGKGKGFLTKKPSKRARALARRAGVKLNPVPFIDERGSNIANWAYVTLDLIRSSYTSPSLDHRPAPLPRGAPPAVMFTAEFFIHMLVEKGEVKSTKRGTLQRYFERWKTRARDYGLERPDAYSHAMPKLAFGKSGTPFFALDVLGAFDAVDGQCHQCHQAQQTQCVGARGHRYSSSSFACAEVWWNAVSYSAP